jgi:DNA polymerase III subunit chi
MEILFYHLERKPLEHVLPGLLERTLERKLRAHVKIGSEERLRVLDDLLWTYREDSFLAHGSPAEGRPEAQPILLSLDDARPNDAAYVFVVDRAPLPDLTAYSDTPPERLILLFDGNDNDALDEARATWKSLCGGRHDLTYWQQNEQGRWEKKG